MNRLLLVSILLPLTAGLAVFIIPQRRNRAREALALLAAAGNLFIAWSLFEKNASFILPWLGPMTEFSLKVYNFSSFILMSAACFTFLVLLYSAAFMRGKPLLKQYYGYLLFAVSFINGVALADNLLVLLFFWEGMLVLMFGLIRIGGKNAYGTAIKAFIIQGVADLCMMAGVALTAYLAGTLIISRISLSCSGALSVLAFVLLVIGAIAKAGAMPFHSWIPDAAEDAPLGFMALLAVCLDKLAGIYLLIRITVDMFHLKAGSGLSLMLMAIGAITIIAAVMMALIQKNYKKMLAYHAVSQSGYMLLGIGTCMPAGIVGGIFHMLNNAHYKSGLFFTAGSVEKQAGNTDLDKLGGLGSRMPVTFICFAVMACSISGAPPFNGFFSKELIYEAALEGGWIFYLAALAGTFFTAVSFLKLGHSVFLGKARMDISRVKEAPLAMLIPMVVVAVLCLAMGLGSEFLFNRWLTPVLEQEGQAHIPALNPGLVLATAAALSLALFHHIARVRETKEALRSADDIHYAPVLARIYSLAEKKYLDPYKWGLQAAEVFSKALMRVDRKIDWVYNAAIPGMNNAFCGCLSAMHSGYYVVYIVWALAGTIATVLFLLK